MLRVNGIAERSGLSTHKTRRVLSEAWRILLIPMLLFLSSRLVVEPFRVEGPSMAPALRDQQLLLINRLAYILHGPQRGQVVVFRWPGAERKDLVKRIIGLPGDRVLIASGTVLVNSQRLDEPYVEFGTAPTYRYPADGQPLHVPAGEFFVLGDNRPESADSRSGWLISAKDVIGQVWIAYWPPTSGGAAGTPGQDPPALALSVG